jgi:hypothetical protein
MRNEHDLRSALRVLEREAPDAGKVLSQVAERTSARTAARGRRPGRRVLAGAAAAATVVAIAVATALLVAPPRGRTAPPNASSVPRYYMALVPFDAQSYAKTGVFSYGYAVVKDRITGRTVATVQPPRPYLGFVAVNGAADDRVFVLTATRTAEGSDTQPYTFFYARFNPADGAVTLTPLALPGLPVSNDYFTAALSPGGTELAVASQSYNLTTARITVYSLPSGAAKTWSARVNTGMPFANDPQNLLSWSSTGSLAIGWIGSIPGNTAGVYLLNTNHAGGSLLADSKKAFCPVPVQPPPSISASTYAGTNTAFLTPDGQTLISGVPQPIPVGQRPPGCTSRALKPTQPELEEFSVSTGQATSVLYPSHAHDAVSDVYWSNASGSVLVVEATLKSSGPNPPAVFGILTGSTFTPIRGASSPPVFQLAF